MHKFIVVSVIVLGALAAKAASATPVGEMDDITAPRAAEVVHDCDPGFWMTRTGYCVRCHRYSSRPEPGSSWRREPLG